MPAAAEALCLGFMTAPAFTAISHLDLTVSDVDRSAEWYAKTLGFNQLMRSDAADRSMAVLMHPASGVIVGLVQHRSPSAQSFDERRPGLDHLAFAVSQREDLDHWQKRLAELGVTHSPVTDDPSGLGTALVFRDPDNIQLELWWMRPRN